MSEKKKVVLLGDSIRLIGYGPKIPALLDAVQQGLFDRDMRGLAARG